MYHFFMDRVDLGPEAPLLEIGGEDYHHMVHVLRLRVGEEVSVSSREGEDREYRCGIEEIGPERVLLRLRFIREEGRELPCRIALFQGLPKGDKMELIVQKFVELGGSILVPVRTSRSMVKLDEQRADRKQKRWQQIAEAAAKQSKRGILPRVERVLSFGEAVELAGTFDHILFPYEMAEGMEKTRQILSSIQRGQSIAVFIGPEGGFAPEEVDLVRAGGGQILTLGRRILRTETAGLTLLSFLLYLLEE